MNILILNYEYPPLGGGAGVCTMEQAKGLLRYGHCVTVVTAWHENLEEVENIDNLKIIRLKSKRKNKHKSSIYEKLSWLFIAKKFLLGYCQTNTFDLCMAHFSIPGAYIASILKKRFGLPYIVISHGHDIPWFFPEQMFLYHLLLYYKIKTIVSEAKALIVLNNNLKNTAVRFLGEKQNKKIFVIPNGCNTEQFKGDTSKKSTVFKIIFTGRLVAQKDPMTFLKALKIFNTSGYEFIAEVIGDGGMKAQMMRYVQTHNLADKVYFRGWVDKEGMLYAYQSASVHVMTSLTEAMSMAALESLSCGVYLISTDVGANAQLIQNTINGTIIPKKNPQTLTFSLVRYYKESYLKNYKIPEDITDNLRNKYDWENITLKYNELLQNIQK